MTEVEACKKSIAELNEAITAAKERQKEATAECKRLEKEMNEFENNKDSKLNEIKVRDRVAGSGSRAQ